MSATIIDGRAISQRMQDEMKGEVERLAARGLIPRLEVILVGDDPASHTYVRSKERACERLGIASGTSHLPATATQQDVLGLVRGFNRDTAVHGILVQVPLPDQIDEHAVINAIDPAKDVDGFHPVNVGKMVAGEPALLPCTPHGILMLLKHAGIDPAGRHVVVAGRSNIVGKPVANLLLQKKAGANAIVTVAHTAAADIGAYTRQADILVVAIGRPKFITADMVKEGVVVIDVGMNRIDDPTRKSGYRNVGDVDFEAVAQKTSAISPVPGGVGLMTITMLMHNTIQAARATLTD